MKLYSWNVNGIRAVLNKGALQEFITKHDPDVLCLQETKAERGQVELDLPQYTEHFFSAVKKGYSGTAILVRKFLSDLQPINVLYDLPNKIANRYNLDDDTFGNPNTEGRVLTIELPEFFLTTVYTPNSKNDLSRLKLRSHQWDPAFRDYVVGLRQHKPVVFCGDLNVAHTEIDLARPVENEGKHGYTREERLGFDALLEAGFIDSFRAIKGDVTEAYTWWTHWANARARNVGWRIDYWLAGATIAEKVKNPEIHPDVLGSDHCPVSIELA